MDLHYGISRGSREATTKFLDFLRQHALRSSSNTEGLALMEKQVPIIVSFKILFNALSPPTNVGAHATNVSTDFRNLSVIVNRDRIYLYIQFFINMSR